MKVSYFIILLMLNGILYASDNQVIAKADVQQTYYFIAVNKLNIREKPDLKSKVLTVLNFCDRVEFLEDTDIIASVQIPNGTLLKGPFYKVKTQQNITGYAFSGFLDKDKNPPFKNNKEKFDIRGSWWKYIDAPTEVIYFLDNNKFRSEWLEYEKKPKVSKGTYAYDGFSKIIVNDENIKRIFDVIIVNGRTTLKEKCFIWDPNYFKGRIK